MQPDPRSIAHTCAYGHAHANALSGRVGSVYITRFDVSMAHASGAQGDREAIHAAICRDMIAACLESGVCKSFTVCGRGDTFSRLEAYHSLPGADTTMYHDELQPKPTYDAVYDTLRRYVIALANMPCPAAG